jgi:hypothetical protein
MSEQDSTEQSQRDKFREALERKQQKSKERVGDNHADGSSKAHDAHGPAAQQRQFRRKSG